MISKTHFEITDTDACKNLGTIAKMNSQLPGTKGDTEAEGSALLWRVDAGTPGLDSTLTNSLKRSNDESEQVLLAHVER